jgi:hypothetical protein
VLQGQPVLQDQQDQQVLWDQQVQPDQQVLWDQQVHRAYLESAYRRERIHVHQVHMLAQ